MSKRRIAAFALTSALVPLPGTTALASGGGGGGSGEGLHFVPMDVLTVPIVDADRVTGKLRFKIVIDAGSAEGAAKATAELPQLRAATLAAGLEFARLNASGLRAVDAEQLDHDLTTALKTAEPALQRVLIVEVAASRT